MSLINNIVELQSSLPKNEIPRQSTWESLPKKGSKALLSDRTLLLNIKNEASIEYGCCGIDR